MEIAIDDQAYEVVSFDAGSCFDMPMSSLAVFVAQMNALAVFWVSFIDEVKRCDKELGSVDEVACALSTHANLDTEYGYDALIDGELGFIKAAIETRRDDFQTSGRLHLAHLYLKRRQLLEITQSIDKLVIADPRQQLASLTVTLATASARTKKILDAFYLGILPRAIAALWLWKNHERRRNATDRDDKQVQLIWMAILKLRAVSQLTSDSANVSLTQMTCIIGARKCPVHPPTKLVADFTLRDILATLRRMGWDMPLITPGPWMRRLVDALWWRCAILASQAFGASVANHGLLAVRIPDTTPPVFRVSEDFVEETERIFNFLCDSLWTLQWFERRRRRLSIDAQATPTKPKLRSPWNDYILKTASGTLADFVKREYSKYVWTINSRRDEIERYNLATKTTQGNPVKSILKFHKADYDTMLPASNSAPASVWGPACETAFEDLQRCENWHRAHPLQEGGVASPEALFEWTWQSLWETSAASESVSVDADNTEEREFETFRLKVIAGGERVFIDKQTGRRLRGEQAVAAAALYAAATVRACKNEMDAIAEMSLYVQMQTASSGSSPILKVTSDIEAGISLASLPDRHTALSYAKPSNPALLRITGYYLAYDGTHTLAQHPFLSEVVGVWARTVDVCVDNALAKLGAVAETVCEVLIQKSANKTVSRQDARKIHAKGQNIVADIPPALRPIFALKRDPQTLLRLGRAVGDVCPNWIGPRLSAAFKQHGMASDVAEGSTTGGRNQKRNATSLVSLSNIAQPNADDEDAMDIDQPVPEPVAKAGFSW